MKPSRVVIWTVLAAFGFGLFAPTARAQDEPLPSKKFDGSYLISLMGSRGIEASALPDARKQFQAFAKYHAEIVSYPLLHKAAQDPSVKAPGDRPIPALDNILRDMQRFLLVPQPRNHEKVNRDSADYIREMGVALDSALKPLVESHPEPIVRINAARMLATACTTGATAHYPTLISLLNNANTPTAVRLYALSAAANLLSAYDVFDMPSRRHSNGWNDTPRGAGEKELAELVTAIEKHVTDPATILNLKEFDAKNATQKDVVRYVRRQAIKALGQVRFVAIPGLGGKTLYPANTLARVCVSDPSLGVDPSPSECAEAAIGLCNMSKFRNGDPIKEYNADTAAEAVTAALVTFAGPRASNPEDKSLPWRGYGLRLSDAIKNWGQMFDFTFNPLKPGPADTPAPQAALNQRAQIALFDPLQKVNFDGKPDLVGGQVLIEDLKVFLKQQRERANRSPLFTGVPATELYMPGKK